MHQPETVASVSASAPRLIGIVNITEDPFSDGGRYLAPAAALAHALKLRADGADIIELGPAASHPDARPVGAAEQRRRLFPVLDQLAADGSASVGTGSSSRWKITLWAAFRSGCGSPSSSSQVLSGKRMTRSLTNSPRLRKSLASEGAAFPGV
jgi:Pterin binding enzyme